MTPDKKKTSPPQPEDLEAIRRLWASVIQKLQEQKPTLSAALMETHAVPHGNEAWTILFNKAFDFDRASTQKQFVADAVAQVAGKTILIEFKQSAPRPQGQQQIPPPSLSASDLIPEHLISINEVYDTVQKNWGLQRRAVQWYVTEGLIPKPKHIGREAFYDKRTIYTYFSLIHTLSRGVYRMPLGQILTFLQKLEDLKTVTTPEGKQRAIAAAQTFLLNHAQYETYLWDTYGEIDEADGERQLLGMPSKTLSAVREHIVNTFNGDPKGIRTILGKKMLEIDAEVSASLEPLPEVPF